MFNLENYFLSQIFSYSIFSIYIWIFDVINSIDISLNQHNPAMDIFVMSFFTCRIEILFISYGKKENILKRKNQQCSSIKIDWDLKQSYGKNGWEIIIYVFYVYTENCHEVDSFSGRHIAWQLRYSCATVNRKYRCSFLLSFIIIIICIFHHILAWIFIEMCTMHFTFHAIDMLSGKTFTHLVLNIAQPDRFQQCRNGQSQQSKSSKSL